MIWRVRGRARMRRLVRQPRHRSGPVVVQRAYDEPGTPPRIAFAIPRSVGSAVVRNRWRRQLRQACREREHTFDIGTSYMISLANVPPRYRQKKLQGDLVTALEASRTLAANQSSR